MNGFRGRLDAALRREQLRAIDHALAEWCLRHGGEPPVALGMLLAQQALGEGHSFLELGPEGPAIPGSGSTAVAGSSAWRLRKVRWWVGRARAAP
jgi:exodeoxyribonuclease V alpha subunit